MMQRSLPRNIRWSETKRNESSALLLKLKRLRDRSDRDSAIADALPKRNG
jgi:hypothetical protein